MKITILALYLFLSFFSFANAAQDEAEQTIDDFNLAGFGEKGRKTWEISGKSADIFSDVVKLKQITGKLYAEDEDIILTAKEGNFDKQRALVHLKNDVVIITTTGAKLTTDSLDWDRRNQVISTKDRVNITRQTMLTKARGAVGHPGLNKISLEKDVIMEISPKEEAGKEEPSADDKVIITCDGPLEIDYEKNIAVFNNNVKVDRKDIQIYSDIMEVYFVMAEKEDYAQTPAPSVMGANIDKIVSRGNVRIVRGENISYSDEAVYTAKDKKIILTGRPKLVIYSQEDF